MIIAWGIYTQQIFVIQDKELVIVRVGYDSNPGNDEWKEPELLKLIFDSIIE
jgi:hypothetical protein